MGLFLRAVLCSTTPIPAYKIDFRGQKAQNFLGCSAPGPPASYPFSDAHACQASAAVGPQRQRIDMLEQANLKMTFELNTIELKMNQKMQQVQEKLMELAQPSQVFCGIYRADWLEGKISITDRNLENAFQPSKPQPQSS